MKYLQKYKNTVFWLTKYIKTKDKKSLILAGLVLCFAVYSLIRYAVASEPTNIKAEYKYAWSENGGWLNFGSSDGGVMVADSALTGYIWSENLGWISLNCSNNNSCAASNYKVANDNEGNLSGYAWSESSGWINFSPADGGVQVDSSGFFSGYAWGENIGWIVFNCDDLDVCDSASFKVKTDWRPLSARESDDSDDDEDEDDLEISDVHYSSTDTTIIVKWETNRDADGSIRWGLDKNNFNERKEENDEKGEDHKITIRELQPSTEYYFRVKSADGDDSDTSRTYSIYTKNSSALFARRAWQSLPESGTEERLEIDISDEREEETAIETEEIAKDKELSFFARITGFLEGIYRKIAGGVKNIALGIRGAFLALQEKIQERAEKIAGLIGEEKRNLEFKAPSEETVKSIERFFTTDIYKKDGAKKIAEVRFQILDKKSKAIPDLETKLFSDPQISVTDENGMVSFRDVEIGEHTLAFSHEEKEFRKKVAIADTLTEEGKIVAEVVRIKAEKEKITAWMWTVIILLILAITLAIYFAGKYYKLKNKNFS